jgi:hypothetical protein
MKGGDTFLVTKQEVDNHLWVIASDPEVNAGEVLIVNLTTASRLKEQVCIIDRNEHPWVNHRTCVNYEDSKIVSLQKLFQLKDSGLIQLQAPLSPLLLQRVRGGASVSSRIPLDHRQLLVAQRLIPG